MLRLRDGYEMGACLTLEREEGKAKKRSEEIDKQLGEFAKQQNNVIKILLLGEFLIGIFFAYYVRRVYFEIRSYQGFEPKRFSFRFRFNATENIGLVPVTVPAEITFFFPDSVFGCWFSAFANKRDTFQSDIPNLLMHL